MTRVSVNSTRPSCPSSRPTPLWLKPPNGARSSTAVALWLLNNVRPLRRLSATLAAWRSSPDQTDEHRELGAVSVGDRFDDRESQSVSVVVLSAGIDESLEGLE
jgi:hypothetical protein